MDDPPSKKCNTKGGLLADDPDLKSLKLKTKEQKIAGGTQSFVNPTKQSTLEGTDLKSLDDGGKKKENHQLQTAVTPLDQKAQSAYANKTGANLDGMSVLAMEKVDKEKLPPKLAPKEAEVIAQDSTQADDSHKISKSKSLTGNKSSSKKVKSQHGADGKKKKNMEDLLDAMMDDTQKTVEDEVEGAKTQKTPTKKVDAAAAPPTTKHPSAESKTQLPPAPKTKLAEVKTQVPTKIMDVESGRSEKKKKAHGKDEKRSSDAIKKIKTPSKRC
uniref:Uncharacterized protein n=1 Tax=Panagrolaimus sp. ES5 TaxID=591445 RepID=A0AC34FG40_9BILA